MRYEGNVFRPPSEAYSLIVQATIGCAHNDCTFCSMYKDKKFRVRNIEEVLEDFDLARKRYRYIEKVFLADGDALVLSNESLMRILNKIKTTLPECQRVGIYAAPHDIIRKTPQELKELRENGLGIAYMGVESGSADILKAVKKGVTPEEMVEACHKLNDAGIQSSVTFISGLGGKDNWREHAVESGKLISKMEPDYVGLLTLMVEREAPLFKDIVSGKFELLSPEEVLIETAELIKNIDLKKKCVFRSNHASNYISLRGDLPKDKERLLRTIAGALMNTRQIKDERFRML
ncbi:MAG: radical SAM protein [Clostridiales bacterium]|nr:radical SAM protein [Clostridiales bacterium]